MSGPSPSLFQGKIMAAPMVRISSLAFRVLCAHFGAGAVFTEELVSAKVAKAMREDVTYRIPKGFVVGVGEMHEFAPGDNDDSNLVDVRVAEFVVYDHFKNMIKRQVVFSTLLPAGDAEGPTFPEGAPVIAQLGAADPSVAAAAAKVLCEFVDGIDVNMGCPKKFSVENGMGAALMKEPERAGKILAAINDAINSDEQLARRPNRRRVGISFKTRIFEDPLKSVDQLRRVVVAAGGPDVVHGITLHARTRDQVSETEPHIDIANTIVRLAKENHPDVFGAICFVFNGSISCTEHGKEFLSLHGNADKKCFEGILIARHALWDPTVFLPNRRALGPQLTDPDCDIAIQKSLYRRVISAHLFYQTNYTFLKYHMTRAFQEFPLSKPKVHPMMQFAKSYGEFAFILGFPRDVAHQYFGAVTFEDLIPADRKRQGTNQVDEPNRKQVRLEDS